MAIFILSLSLRCSSWPVATSLSSDLLGSYSTLGSLFFISPTKRYLTVLSEYSLYLHCPFSLAKGRQLSYFHQQNSKSINPQKINISWLSFFQLSLSFWYILFFFYHIESSIDYLQSRKRPLKSIAANVVTSDHNNVVNYYWDVHDSSSTKIIRFSEPTNKLSL